LIIVRQWRRRFASGYSIAPIVSLAIRARV
jgi:hypothetical protein